jgi:hypothetical protein
LTVSDKPQSPYSTLPAEGPYEVRVGSALITMVEPHAGHEVAYNRWYEDDHFYAGAMAMPWMFSGRRWVATRDLQQLRYPADSAIAQPVTAGCYITVYWITEGRYRDHIRWTVATNGRLLPDGRVFQERSHIFTAFQEYGGAVYRDGENGPRDIHALDHPYQGLVMEVVDGHEGADRAELIRWLKDEHVAPALAGSPAALCAVFTPMPLPTNKATYVQDVPGGDRRVTLLWFLEVDPRDCWAAMFKGLGDAVSAAGAGRAELVAPFIPTVPGTNRYVDQLRG